MPGEPGTAAPSPVDEAEAKGPDAAPIPVPADKGSEESPSPVEGSLAKGPEESPSLVPADKGPEASQVPVKESEEQKAEEDAIDKVISKQPDAVPDTSITVPIATPVTTTTGQIVSVTPPPMYGPELPPTPPTSMDVKPATDEKTTNADDQSQKPDEDIMNKAIDYIADRIAQKLRGTENQNPDESVPKLVDTLAKIKPISSSFTAPSAPAEPVSTDGALTPLPLPQEDGASAVPVSADGASASAPPVSTDGASPPLPPLPMDKASTPEPSTLSQDEGVIGKTPDETQPTSQESLPSVENPPPSSSPPSPPPGGTGGTMSQNTTKSSRFRVYRKMQSRKRGGY